MTQSGDRPDGDELADQEQIADIAPATQQEQVAKDLSYSPSSGRETEQRQQSPNQSAATADADVDADAVETLPGTGGPDDTGAVDVDEDDLNMPRDHGAH